MTKFILTILIMLGIGSATIAQDMQPPKRIGIIGTTTSHVPAFANQINDPNGNELMQRYEVTAAYAGGMPDNPSSWGRVSEYTKALVDKGVTMYPTIEEMLEHVDFVMLESVDGRPHLEQARPVIAAGKPMYIDKPMAGSLADVLEIFRLAEENNVPIFTASSLRYGKDVQDIRNNKPHGKVIGCDAFSPCSLNDKHPDLYWYGVHGVETLFSFMGPGCVSVTRMHSEGSDVVVGLWNDGRIGTFRGIRQGKTDYGARVVMEKAIVNTGQYDGYGPLGVEICKFFDTLQPPVDPQETIEMFAFMSAADVSWYEARRISDGVRPLTSGSLVTLQGVIDRAKNEKAVYKNIVIPADYGKNAKTFVLVDGKEVPTSILKDAMIWPRNNSVVKVILRSEKGVDFKFVQEVLEQLDEVYLANYLYE